MQSGQVVRVTVDGRAVRFTVDEILYDADDRADRVGNGKPARDATRWAELLIVRTSAGRIAMRDAWRTRWMEESDRNEWHVYSDEAAASAALAARAAELLPRDALRELGWWDAVAEEV